MESTLSDPDEKTEELLQVLRESCIDPDLGVNVVDLGFVRDARVDENGVAIISMTLCSEVCPLGKVIADQARTAIVGTVASELELEFTFAQRWRPDDITDDGRRRLEEVGFGGGGPLEVRTRPAHRGR
jgi:metal-sulfur cluster biosynthetic enzyme